MPDTPRYLRVSRGGSLMFTEYELELNPSSRLPTKVPTSDMLTLMNEHLDIIASEQLCKERAKETTGVSPNSRPWQKYFG